MDFPHISSTALFFGFFEKVTLGGAILKKLPCHTDFSHMSLIAWLNSFAIQKVNIYAKFQMMNRTCKDLLSKYWSKLR